jgi:hypothetical protein
MIQKELRQHQWKAFRRNPMFERNLGVRIFMFIIFGFLAAEFLMFGFFLDKLLLEIGEYGRAIDSFNSLLLYVFAFDFVIKFFFKPDQSMQIAPYLSLPVKRNSLFNFLLRKEFTSFWNFYLLFLVVPFAFKAITPFYGFISAVLYILFFYLLCIINSLIVSFVNNLIKRSVWFYIPIVAFVILPFIFPVTGKLDIGAYTQLLGELLLDNHWGVWIGLIVLLITFWVINRVQMRNELYRELQGEKAEKISSFSKLSFLDQFGEIGEFIQLEIKMILRSKRLKQQVLIAECLFLAYFVWILYSPGSAHLQSNNFTYLLYGMITVGFLGLIMGQYPFTSESSFFDGMMARNLSIFNMLKSKYLLYSSIALLITLLLLTPVFHGKMSLLLLIANFFYVIGPVFFMIFQNAVYNKTYFDLFDRGMMNWKGQSSNMIAITLIAMFFPVILVLIIIGFFGEETAYWFMIVTGILFTLTSRQWLQWIYKRFLKRKYKNMEGFRANA